MADLDLTGIITRVCTNLKAKFSKVVVSRSLTSGTKSATVTVDGTAYDLYAPTPPVATTTAPLMDGTASYGSGTAYARSNHVHPTDTSRAASTHIHGSITSVGAITSDTAVESGDKLVIVDANDVNKLKRSGIAFGTDTTTFLRNDGTWAAAGGGGGGVNKLILYTDNGETNLWIDQARTTTLFESYGYDYSVAKAALTDTDIIWIWNYNRCRRYLVVSWNIDTIDETFEIAAATGMGQVGSYGDYTRCRKFSIYQ